MSIEIEKEIVKSGCKRETGITKPSSLISGKGVDVVRSQIPVCFQVGRRGWHVILGLLQRVTSVLNNPRFVVLYKTQSISFAYYI